MVARRRSIWGASASTMLAATSSADMPMPMSSMVTTNRVDSPGERWLRMRTSELGGENVVAFSMSSQQVGRSATARPTSMWSLTSTSTCR